MEMKGFKQTEVGMIPNDWNLIDIGTEFSFKNGLNKEKHYFGYGIPIVNYMDVYRLTCIKQKDIKGRVYLTQQEIKNYQVQKGDVLFTRTSETVEEIGISSVICEELIDTVFSGFLLRGRPKNNLLDIEFCRYCFSSAIVRKQILTTASYTTRALTNGRLLSEVKIPLPPTKAEQTAIATALNDADALIQKLEQLIAKKRLIKQGAMQELLKPKEGWEVKKLGEVAEIKKGQLITEKTAVPDGIPVIGGGMTVSYYHNKPNRKGITITISASGAYAGYVSIHNYPIFASDCSTISEEEEYDIYYLYFCLLNKQREIYSLQTGGGQPHVYPQQLRDLFIPIPKDKNEQTRIAQILSDMDNEIEALEKQLEKYKKIKQGMMQVLLTGKIRLVKPVKTMHALSYQHPETNG